MTNNHDNDEFNQYEGGDVEPAQPQGVKQNLAEAWRTKPLLKLFVIVVVVGGIIAVVSSMIEPDKKTDATAQVVVPPDMKNPPGGAVSPYFKKQQEMADLKRTQDALKSGGSAMITPQGVVADLDDMQKRSDPLTELKAETEKIRKDLERTKQEQQKKSVVVPQGPPVNQGAQQTDDNLAQVMQVQMGQLMEQWRVRGMKSVTVTREDPAAKGTAINGVTRASATGIPGLANASTDITGLNASQSPIPVSKTIIPAGTVNYGQLLTEANSDVPGPIMMQIMSGPFAGARAVGAFEVKNDYLVLRYTLINFEGKDYSVDAYALDPNTTLAGMATDVDDRYFTRVVLPAAAAFLEGLGSSLGQTPQSVVTNGTTTIVTQADQGFNDGMYKGLGEAAKSAGTFFRDQANRTKQLVRVASGTPMGLFFIRTVKEEGPRNRLDPMANNGPNNYMNALQRQQQMMQGNMPSYPGANVSGYGGGPYGPSGSGGSPLGGNVGMGIGGTTVPPGLAPYINNN